MSGMQTSENGMPTGCGCGGAKCRLAAGDKRHGRYSAYCKGCRCDACREGRNSYRRARYAGDPDYREREKEKSRAAHERDAARVNEQRNLRRQANLERERERDRVYREENRSALLAYYAAWRLTPEGQASRRAAHARRRARTLSADCGCVTRDGLQLVWLLDSGRCAYCNAPGTDYEHVVPLARGGWGCVSNFRVACKSCNSRKGTKPLSVFLTRLAASGVTVRPGATNAGLPCSAAAARMAGRMLPASPRSVTAA